MATMGYVKQIHRFKADTGAAARIKLYGGKEIYRYKGLDAQLNKVSFDCPVDEYPNLDSFVGYINREVRVLI